MIKKILKPFAFDKKKAKQQLQNMGVLSKKNILHFQISAKYSLIKDKQQHLKAAIDQLRKHEMSPLLIFKISLYLHGALQNFDKAKQPEIILEFLSFLLKQIDSFSLDKQNPQTPSQKRQTRPMNRTFTSPQQISITGQQKENQTSQKYNLVNFLGERIVGPYISYLLKFTSEIQFIHKTKYSSQNYDLQLCFIALNLIRSASKAVIYLAKYVRLKAKAQNQLIQAMLYYLDADIKALHRKIKKYIHPNLMKIKDRYINAIQQIQYTNSQFLVQMDNFETFFELTKQVDNIRQQLTTHLYLNSHLSKSLYVLPRKTDWINLHNSQYDFLFQITKYNHKKYVKSARQLECNKLTQ